MPKGPAFFAPCATSAAAMRSLLGMQPTRAHIVPGGPCSMSSTRAPVADAAWYAARPAVPAPRTATSTERCGLRVDMRAPEGSEGPPPGVPRSGDELDLDPSILTPVLRRRLRAFGPHRRGLDARLVDAVGDEEILDLLGSPEPEIVVVLRRPTRVGVPDEADGLSLQRPGDHAHEEGLHGGLVVSLGLGGVEGKEGIGTGAQGVHR